MLTVFSLTNSKEAASYYEADNYYTRDSAESFEVTQWWGRGAEFLGLSGYVDSQKFVEILEGKIGSQNLGRGRNDGGVSHKPGYDLTFSAPKSVSMLAEIGGDNRVHDAHNKAVNRALEYLQNNVAQYRKTTDGNTQVMKADNLIIAKFRHDTSRSVEDTIDCQLHTHCVVANAIRGEDNEWRSLFEKPIFDFTKVGGMIYRSALARELKKIGYRIEKTRKDGLFEVAGISRFDIETFSKRRIKILDVMSEKGLFGVEAAQRVTLQTRESKIAVDREKLKSHWNERAEEIGLDLGALIKESKAHEFKGLVSDSNALAGRAIRYALEHLSSRQSVFLEKDIISTALHYSLGDIDIDDIESELGQFKESGLLISLGSEKFQNLYTTEVVLQREQRILEMVSLGINESPRICSKQAVDLYFKAQSLSSQYQPTDCQRKAVEFLATETDQFLAVQGYAGTGKTTMLKAICEIGQQAGYSIIGASPQASAADVLRNETQIETRTLSSLLIELKKEKPSPEEKRQIIILDEASMASTLQMEDLVAQARRLNKRIFMVGDKLQLPSVEAGCPFALMQEKNLNTVFLKQIVRQKADDLKWGVNEVIRGGEQGDPGFAFDAIGHSAFTNSESSVVEIEDRDQRLSAISNRYLSLSHKDKNDTIVLLGSNKDRQEVNDLIRSGLKNSEQISGDEFDSNVLLNKGMTAAEKQHIFNYQVGDVVRFNKAYRSLGVKKFGYYRVEKADAESEQLILRAMNGKKTIQWTPEGSAKTNGSAVEVYEETARRISSGDFIRWTQNKKDLGIFNTETAEVLEVNGSIAKIKLRNNDLVKIDVSESRNSHWDYAWSSTVYAAQGKKAKNVIAQAESYNPHMTNYRSFYVTLSRAVNKITLFCDDIEGSKKTIAKNTGEKSNATQFLEFYQQKMRVNEYITNSEDKLKGNIYGLTDKNERFTSLANKYCDLQAQNSVHLVCSDFKDRQAINAGIREVLKSKGKIDKTQELVYQSLRPYRVRTSENNMQLKEGMVLRFNRGFKKIDCHKGDYFLINDTSPLTNEVIVLDGLGNSRRIDIQFIVDRQGKEVDVYKVDKLPLAAGDQVVWTKSFRNEGVNAGSHAKVVSINDKEVVFEINGKEKAYATKDHSAKHWKYAYCKDISDKVPQSYHYALAHLDEKTQSHVRADAIFGLLGKARTESYMYSESTEFVVNHLNRIKGLPLSMEEKNHDEEGRVVQFSNENNEPKEELKGLIEVNSLLNKKSENNTHLNNYLESSKKAASAWARIYQCKDFGLKPSSAQLDLAKNLSEQRNRTAHQILVNDTPTMDNSNSNISSKMLIKIKKHAKAFVKQQKLAAKEIQVAKSKDWRTLIDYEQSTSVKIHGNEISPTRKLFWDKNQVLSKIEPFAEDIIDELVCEKKNLRLSKGDKTVWGSKNGSVHYHRSGSKKGLINDYERNVHGDVINYYTKRRGLDWYDGLCELAAKAGINPEKPDTIPVPIISEEEQKKKDQSLKDELKRRDNLRQLANKTWDDSVSIKGTVVERYLKKHRGITCDTSQFEVRYNNEAPIYKYKEGRVVVFDRKPAMVVRFNEPGGELSAVQCTYIDPNTADKDKSAKIPKNTVGSHWGSAGLIYRGGNKKIILAEGAETAMSLVEAEPDASIYITGGNMQNMQHYEFLSLEHGLKEFDVACDNDLSDTAPSFEAVKSAAEKLSGLDIKCSISMPESIANKKTDFNDVLKKLGSDDVKKQFDTKINLDFKKVVNEKSHLDLAEML